MSPFAKVAIFALLAPALLMAATFPHGIDVVTGKAVTVPAAGTKAKVVLFLSSRCPCSKSHEPTIAKIYERFASKGVAFIGVHSNADESEQESKSHFTEAKLPFSVIRDHRARWADEYGALKTPHAFVLNEHDQVVFSGGVDDSRQSRPDSKPYLALALEAVTEGRKPDPDSVRSLGCVISRP